MTKADENYSYPHFGCGGTMMPPRTDGAATSVRIEWSIILGAPQSKEISLWSTRGFPVLANDAPVRKSEVGTSCITYPNQSER
jgi:hypothetical protein